MKEHKTSTSSVDCSSKLVEKCPQVRNQVLTLAIPNNLTNEKICADNKSDVWIETYLQTENTFTKVGLT